MKVWSRIYNVIRSVLVTAILAVPVVYVVLYLIMSIPAVQDRVRQVGCRELTKLLGTEVNVGDIYISPFDQLVIYDVVLPDQQGDTIMRADKVGVGFSLFNLVVRQRLVFTYGELIGVDVRLNKATPVEPLNIQFIIDALSPKQKDKPPTLYDLNIQNIVVRRSKFSYDVLSADTIVGKFDPNHVRIEDIRADISLPRIKNDDYFVELRRFSLRESNGFVVRNMSVEAIANDTLVGLSNMKIELPNTLLTIGDISVPVSGLKNVGNDLLKTPLRLSMGNSHLTLSDFKAFAPALVSFDFPINLDFSIEGTLNELTINDFSVRSINDRITMGLRGRVNNVAVPDALSADVNYLNLSADAGVIASIVSNATYISPQAQQIITNCGNVGLSGRVNGDLSNATIVGTVSTSLGKLALEGVVKNQQGGKYMSYSGRVETENFDAGKLLSRENLLGTLSCDIDMAVRKRNTVLDGKVNGHFGHIDLKGYRYNDINANVVLDNKLVSGEVSVNDRNGALSVNGVALIDGTNSVVDVDVDVTDVELSRLNLTQKFPNKKLSLDLKAHYAGNDLNNFAGNVSVNNLTFCDSVGEGIHISQFLVDADNSVQPKVVTITSDVVNGSITGQYDVYGIARSIKAMLARPFPALFGTQDIAEESKPKSKSRNKKKKYAEPPIPNNLFFNFEIDNTDELAELFNLPVRPLSAVNVEGYITDSNHSLFLLANAPYLRQKNKLIEGTWLQLALDGVDNNMQVDAYSIIPLKKGKMALTVAANGVNDRIDTDVEWIVDNNKAFSGELNVSSLLLKDTIDNNLAASIDINHTEILFNDTAWVVHPAHIEAKKNDITVDDLLITCEKQFIKIDGCASDRPEDEVVVELNDINLDYVFETLAIDNVSFGGRATGIFYASDLFSGVPRLYTEGLYVDNLAYNKGVFGDAKILSSWINEDKCIAINADVSQENGLHTTIDGKIFLARDSLYFDFKPQRANIAFLRPFMSAFSSDIQGEASGHAVLYGTFKNINLWGDVFADSLKMKLDYTNVYYTASDSVKMRPGIIEIKNIELRDPMGHTARLSGTVTHEYFHNATFNFSLTQARNFLCYDVNQKMSPDWYGRVFGNGSAFILGQPGFVNIDVNMTTADNSVFTFVLSDSKVATEYNFITFVDRYGKVDGDQLSDARPERVREFLKAQQQQEEGTPSMFNFNLMIEATPQAQMILVMDPAGGDKIRATGDGNLRIGYNSADEEMTIFGTYTLERGSYNFTLQDIIIKEFTIREGSSLTFNGDPFTAVMNIEGIYSTHANLTDLDESFATDGDLNRTNVPVNALVRLQGELTTPDISFDLEFPTLTSDVYRKVRSIVSTEDMMNRQIIYLLALNSFYTPDYMADGNRGNELASVASSTISSQLSNLLGQMSDNWSISPNFRSDNGDFSDIEVELALSSQLLNNRLLFNGNFGYRDNALNTRNSNFIGDFDIEYLLTKSGNIRLKAYNHYNDQNYYVRSALTTQGVGVVFKHDFDGWHDMFWKRKRRNRKSENTVSVDTVSSDSIFVRERVEITE